MPANEITTPSINNLPMDDISEFLKVIGFIVNGDKATDVEYVAGIPAENIAISISPDDRTTVNNALHLGGIPASEYVTQSTGNEIINTNESQGSEIKELRDELYQLKYELSKRGIVTKHEDYSGFTDTFNPSDILYIKDFITKGIKDSNTKTEIYINNEDIYKFDIGDYIVIYSPLYDIYHVAQITDVDDLDYRLEFTPAAGFNICLDDEVYKSCGEYINGTYQFSRKSKKKAGSTEYHTGLDDDTFKTRKSIIKDNTGYAFTFRLNSFAKGFLTKLTIQAKSYGTPGDLMCYIIDEENIAAFKNPTQAENDGILLAKSKPLTVDPTYGERLWTFDFFDGTSYPLLNEPDTNNKTVRYCAIVECLKADSGNYIDLVMLKPDLTKYPTTSLQMNNTTYKYEYKIPVSTEEALSTNDSINEYDIFYNIVTRDVEDSTFEPFREGIYTAKKYLQEPIRVNSARLMLRVGREGYYQVDSPSNTSFANYSFVPIVKDPELGINYDMSQLSGFGFNAAKGDKCIIGSFIRDINGFNDSGIELKNGVYLEEDNMPLYRAAYKVFLKARLKEYDEVNNVYKYSNITRIELPLENVMLDRIKKSPTISDRLIYEGSFVDAEDKDLFFNDFELQIYWRTEYSGVYSESKYKDDFVGRIHDLVLSFDR